MPSLSYPSRFKRRSSLPLVVAALSLALAGCAANNKNAANTLPDGKVGPSTLNVADAAIAGGDPSMALNVSQSILADDPDNVDALVHEGQAFYALNRCPAAEAAFQKALAADPKSAPAETGLGRCLLKLDPKSAEAAFLAATQDDPGDAAAFSDLGIARDLQNNFAGAAQAYQQSLALNAGSIATSVNLGLSLALSGQGELALQYLGPIATGPDATPKIRQDYAVALVAAGRPDDARQVLAVDMTQDQINAAMQAYQTLVSQSVTAPPAPAPMAAAQPMVQTTPVTSAPMAQAASSPVMLAPVNNAASPPADPPVAAANEAPAVSPPAPAPQYVASTQPAPPHPIAAAPTAMQAATITPVAAAAPVAANKPVPKAPSPAKMAAVVPAPKPPLASSPAPAAAVPETTNMAETAPKPIAAAPAAAKHEVASAAPASIPAQNMKRAKGGHAAVQIAALNSAEAAHKEWNLVSSKAPALFAGKSPEILKVAVNGQTYYRLRVTGFANHQDAAQFCEQLTSSGGTCVPANF